MISSLQNQDPQKVASVALTVFFNITKGWKLKPKQELILIGSPPRSTFYKWKSGKVNSISGDTLERISYIMHIYQSLRKVFPTVDHANTWPHKANSAFGDESALTYMLQGSMQHIADVKRYLDEVVK